MSSRTTPSARINGRGVSHAKQGSLGMFANQPLASRIDDEVHAFERDLAHEAFISQHEGLETHSAVFELNLQRADAGDFEPPTICQNDGSAEDFLRVEPQGPSNFLRDEHVRRAGVDQRAHVRYSAAEQIGESEIGVDGAHKI